LPCAIAGTARSAKKLPSRRVLDRIGFILEVPGARVELLRLPQIITDRASVHASPHR
jgi:hypothetical protein